jgi:hypothetical protein
VFVIKSDRDPLWIRSISVYGMKINMKKGIRYIEIIIPVL